MRVIEEIGAMRAASADLRRAGLTLGLVPTMGALHEGHLSLVRLARSGSDRVVVSVFVNPMQFGPAEDYERYPRDLGGDCARLEREGCDLVFAPPAAAMYPAGFRSVVAVRGLSDKLCGRSRPGHFDGVATVVLKLLEIVSPDRAVFGEKDAQQLVVVRRMVEDLNLGVEIVAGPTVREPDGLAASSRNRFLSPDERAQAVCLIEALRRADALARAGEKRASTLVGEMERVLATCPLARPEYAAVVDPRTLEDLEVLEGPALAALAVRLGRTRLIDNLTLRPGA